MKMTSKLVMAAASAIFLPFFANADYALLEWIQGSGSAWIYSGYKPNPTDRLEMKLRATDIGVTDALFCARGPTSYGVNMFVATRIGSNFRIDFGNNGDNMKTLSTPVVNTATDYLLVLDGNAMRGWVASVDSGEELGSTSYTARPTPAGPIALYAVHTLGAGLSASTPLSSMAAFGTFRMYWCKVYDASGALVRHWVPARDNTAAADAVGRYGVIDLCTNEFFPCLGTTQFTAGPEASFAECEVTVTAGGGAEVSIDGENWGDPLEFTADVGDEITLYAQNSAASGSRFVWSGLPDGAEFADLLHTAVTFSVPPSSAIAITCRSCTSLEWIQGSGSAWIFSGYAPKPTDRLEMKLRATRTMGNEALFCARDAASANTFTSFRIESNFRFDFGIAQPPLSSLLIDTSADYVLALDGDATIGAVAAADGETMLCQVVLGASPPSPRPMALFAAHTLGAGLSASTPLSSMAAFGTFRMYWCKVYDASGALVRHWVPARDNTAAADAVGRYGVLDLCTNEFFPCLGTTQFTAGPEASFAECEVTVTAGGGAEVSLDGENWGDPLEFTADVGDEITLYAQNSAASRCRFVWSGLPDGAEFADSRHTAVTFRVPPSSDLAITCRSDVYALLEWIQGSGSAWIYSGYRPNPTDRLEMKLRATDIGVTDALFCARGPTSYRVNMFVATRIGSNFRIDFGNNDGNMKTLSTPVVNTATDYLLVLDGIAMRGWVASVDSGEELGSTSYTARPTPAGPIALYAAHTLGAGLSASTPLSSMAAFGTFRMYWCKVYDASGALVRHWVPARDNTAAADAVGRYGVLDLCTNEFFPCLGNAQFTPGPRIRTMGTFIYVR